MKILSNLSVQRVLLLFAVLGSIAAIFLLTYQPVKAKETIPYPSPFEGNAFFLALENADWLARAESGAKLDVLESGLPIGKLTENIRLVEEAGLGTFFLYDRNIYFSSSDNTSAAENGRTYEIVEFGIIPQAWVIGTSAGAVLFWFLFCFAALFFPPPVLNNPARWLPREALSALAGILVFLAILVAAIEFLLLPWLIRGNLMGDTEWERENSVINANTEAENPHGIEPDAPWLWTSSHLDHEASLPGEFRILVVGDSFVWGDGLANINDTVWRQLERYLHQTGIENVRLIGFGQCGSSTLQQFDALREQIGSIQPDLVLWQYVSNDADMGNYRQLGALFAQSDRLVRVLRKLNDMNVLPRLVDFLIGKRIQAVEKRASLKGIGYTYFEWEKQLLQKENLERYAGLLREIRQWAENNDLPMTFYPVPSQVNPQIFSESYAPIQKVVEAEGLPWIDTLQALPQLTGDWGLHSILQWGANPVNGHPGILINRPVAVQVGDWIRSRKDLVNSTEPQDATRIAAAINHVRPWNLTVEREGEKRWKITIPPGENLFLSKPFGAPTAVVYFANPVQTRRMQVTLPANSEARIFVQTETEGLSWPIQRWAEVGGGSPTGGVVNIDAGQFEGLPINAVAFTVKEGSPPEPQTVLLSVE